MKKWWYKKIKYNSLREKLRKVAKKYQNRVLKLL